MKSYLNPRWRLVASNVRNRAVAVLCFETGLTRNLATNFQDLVTKVKNLVALAPVLGTILRPVFVAKLLHDLSPNVLKFY